MGRSSDVTSAPRDARDIKTRTIRGSAIVMASQGGRIALKLAETVLLARLLAPEEIGSVIMVTSVTGIAQIFRDGNLSMGTIQRDEVSVAQVSTLFWINVVLASCVSLVVVAASPAIAWFYGDRSLIPLTVAVGCTMALAGPGAQHVALLKRQMRFGALAVVELASTAIALAVAVVLASSGAGSWALVGMLAVQPAMHTALAWGMTGWIPGRPGKLREVKGFLLFGGTLTGFELVNYASRRADHILIGRVLGSSPLALYSRAYELMLLPVAMLRGPLVSVGLPAMSRLRADPVRYREYYIRMTEVLATASMPLAVLLLLLAEPFIELALGAEWLGVVPIFQTLALTAFLQPSAGLRGLVLLSSGEGQRYLWLGVGLAVVYVASFIVGIQWGAVGVAAAYTVANYVSLYPSFSYAFKGSSVRPLDYFRSAGRPATSSVVAGACVFCGMRAVDGAVGSMVLIGGVTAAYVAAYLLLFGLTRAGRNRLRAMFGYAQVLLPRRGEV